MNLEVTGIEAKVCSDIANRQAKGLAKYGTTVEENPLPLREWLQHAYEENLDSAIYLRRAISEIEINSGYSGDSSSAALLCPIYDKNGTPMNVGDRFTYQGGTQFSSVVTIEMRDGEEWLSFSDGTPSTPLADFWYAPTDEKISRRHNAKLSNPGESAAQ